ncbi:PrgI family protein [Candidatus Saccharibacteria bacterium]|nr:PrgI family protein [Candidatus Saccharibacteria bacterium]
MSVYKVPQDVEAEDKLLGPFTFRQFIYLLIVAGAIALGWVLASQVFVGLALIVLPIVVFFGALALPLKKDQPMEAYLSALVSFHLKPRKRLWRSEGVESTIEITVPKKVEERLTKDLSEHEASRRLSYLANIMDTEGWAVKGVMSGPLREDVYAETMGMSDMLDTAAPEVANLEQLMMNANKSRHDELLKNTQLIASGAVVPAPVKPVVPPKTFEVTIPDMAPIARTPVAAGVAGPEVVVSPAENIAAQSLVSEPPTTEKQPASEVIATESKIENSTQTGTAPEVKEEVEPEVSDDILRLLNNKDLSVETIAKEANRLKEQKAAADGEVYVSLR